MRFGRPPERESDSIPFETAFLSWLPIALGIILGTMTRFVAFLLGGGTHASAAGSVLFAAIGAVVAVIALERSSEVPDWRGVIRLGTTWLLLSMAFRAVWLGVVIGGGWEGVRMDYEAWKGQPGVFVLALTVAAPLVLLWRHHKAELSS